MQIYESAELYFIKSRTDKFTSQQHILSTTNCSYLTLEQYIVIFLIYFV